MTEKTRAGSKNTFANLFTPKLVTVLREGYKLRHFRADILAGLTVAIVALPLSMAIAIASGVTPAQGLYTAIIGGFFVSLLGGSRFQVGGPAGAFIVLVAITLHNHGLDGLMLATMMSGIFLACAGFLRLGTYVKFIPYPVTVGFTAGIAVIIFASQIKELFGMTISGKEPAAIIPKLQFLWDALPTISPHAFGVSLFTIAVIILVRYFRPNWPAFLIAVFAASIAATLLHLPVDTIGTRFGGIPRSLPAPSLNFFSIEKILEVLPAALSFTMLGAIESLLSAVVADGMTGRRHRSNCELVAQGVANIMSSIFGGFCVTGTIARTATNVRTGAHSPISGMLHAVFVLLFMLVAAPLASFIPLASLAGVLAIVAWNMVEKEAVVVLLKSSWGDALVLLATFTLTVFRDLTEGILVGFGLGTLLFLNRMAHAVEIEAHIDLTKDDIPDVVGRKPVGATVYEAGEKKVSDLMVYRISGAFFFGSASTIGGILDELAYWPKILILDFEAVPFLDSTAANTIERLVHKAQKNHMKLVLTGVSPHIGHVLGSHNIRPPRVEYYHTLGEALTALAPSHSKKAS